MCVKLLSLLCKHSQGQMQTMMDGFGNQGMPAVHGSELKVSNSRGNIYPTALLPYLPKEVAGELLQWFGRLVEASSKEECKEEEEEENASAGSGGKGPEESEEGGCEELPKARIAPRGNTAVGGGPWRH